ncbi:MAG: hypothetical protein NTZ05_12610 [Chloroflexi bacterium]|nr:hypothetical protein [Chloroflexota bacterium]
MAERRTSLPKTAPAQPPPWRTPPRNWAGSDAAYAIYWAFLRLKYVEGVTFQRGGGSGADFSVPDLRIVIRIQGFGNGQSNAVSMIQKIQMEGQGVTVVDIDSEAALKAPIPALQRALEGVSTTSGGGW